MSAWHWDHPHDVHRLVWHPICGDHLQSENHPRESSRALPHVGSLVKELCQCELQPAIDDAREGAEDGHHVQEVPTAVVSLKGDAFPKKGGHVVVKVPVVQMKERGEEESTPLLVVPHAPCADADLVYVGPMPSKASSSDVRLEIG